MRWCDNVQQVMTNVRRNTPNSGCSKIKSNQSTKTEYTVRTCKLEMYARAILSERFVRGDATLHSNHLFDLGFYKNFRNQYSIVILMHPWKKYMSKLCTIFFYTQYTLIPLATNKVLETTILIHMYLIPTQT